MGLRELERSVLSCSKLQYAVDSRKRRTRYGLVISGLSKVVENRVVEKRHVITIALACE